MQRCQLRRLSGRRANPHVPGFKITTQTKCQDPADNSSDPGITGTLDSQRSHRYLLTVFQPIKDILVAAHKASRPAPNFDKITMHRGQEEIYLPGKIRWKPIEVTFYQAQLSSGVDTAASKIYSWWANTVYSISSGSLQSDYQTNADLAMLDGNGQPNWVYHMLEAWPEDITPTELDYSASAIAEITVKIAYNKCTESGQGTGFDDSPGNSSSGPFGGGSGFGSFGSII